MSLTGHPRLGHCVEKRGYMAGVSWKSGPRWREGTYADVGAEARGMRSARPAGRTCWVCGGHQGADRDEAERSGWRQAIKGLEWQRNSAQARSWEEFWRRAVPWGNLKAEPAALQGCTALDSSKRDGGLPGPTPGEPEHSQGDLTLGHLVTAVPSLQKTDTSMGQNRDSSNGPTQIWSIDFGQRCQDHSLGKNNQGSFGYSCATKQIKEKSTKPLPHTTYKT